MAFDVNHLQSLIQSENNPLEQYKSANATLAPSYPAFKIQVFDELASTSSTVWEWIEQGAEEGTVAIALQQRAGRGQWGHQWLSLSGGLYLSLALMPNLIAAQSGQLTLCIAWGIGNGLRSRGVPVQLKWPNDLVVDGLKLGGILTETRIQKGRVTKAVVGIGINWCNSVPPTGINLSQIQANNPQLAIASLEELAAIVLLGAINGYRRWQHQGIDAILPCYHAIMAGIGTTIEFDGHIGQLVGVTSTGALKVKLQVQAIPPIYEEVDVQPGNISLGYVCHNANELGCPVD